jgi:hypothetical protein
MCGTEWSGTEVVLRGPSVTRCCIYKLDICSGIKRAEHILRPPSHILQIIQFLGVKWTPKGSGCQFDPFLTTISTAPYSMMQLT